MFLGPPLSGSPEDALIPAKTPEELNVPGPLASVEVIRPNDADVTLVLGLQKFVWLKMLKNSDRNCTLTFSPSLVVLNNPMSQANMWGPRRMPLPRVPNVPMGLPAKAAGLNHSRTGS